VDGVRYGLALVLVMCLPALLLFWVLIHPCVRFWRRVGAGWAYAAVGAVATAGMMGVYLVRAPLLRIEFGTSYPLMVLGFLFVGAAALMRGWLQRRLPVRVLLGLPELAPDRHPGRLITEGIYARLRHPRYVEVALALLGYACIANYLAAYLVFALWLPAMHVIVLLEERELRDRFGEAYEAYCRRVPRFLPRFSRGP